MMSYKDMMKNTAYTTMMDAFYKAMDADTISAQDIEDMTWCDRCPFASICSTDELFYGCGVWEEMMGDDL